MELSFETPTKPAPQPLASAYKLISVVKARSEAEPAMMTALSPIFTRLCGGRSSSGVTDGVTSFTPGTRVIVKFTFVVA